MIVVGATLDLLSGAPLYVCTSAAPMCAFRRARSTERWHGRDCPCYRSAMQRRANGSAQDDVEKI